MLIWTANGLIFYIFAIGLLQPTVFYYHIR